MNVNGTIVIQAINFFIAYVLLRYLLFKPAKEAIDQDHVALQQLEDVKQEGVHLLEQKQRKEADQWKGFRNYFGSHRPSITPADLIVRDITPPIIIKDISPDTKKELTSAVCKSIVRHFGEDE